MSGPERLDPQHEKEAYEHERDIAWRALGALNRRIKAVLRAIDEADANMDEYEMEATGEFDAVGHVRDPR